MAAKLRLSSAIPLDQLQGESDLSALKDARVLITGGASGLGAAFATTYAEAGAHVTIADLNESLANDLVESLKPKGASIQAVKTDTTSWASLVAAFQSATKFGPGPHRLDHVITCAGVDNGPFYAPPSPSDPAPSADNAPPEPSLAIVDINLKGTIYAVRLAQHYLGIPSAASHDKSVTLMCSTSGYIPIPLNGIYGATKGGVRALFTTMRGPLASQGIRLNMLAPWLIETPMTHGLLGVFGKLGYPVYQPEVAVKAAMWLATDTSVVGRCLQAGLGGICDMGDDAQGGHGGVELERIVRMYLGGYEGLNDKNKAILTGFGYVDIEETM